MHFPPHFSGARFRCVVTFVTITVMIACAAISHIAPAAAESGLPDGRAYELVSGGEVGEAYYPRSGFLPLPRADEGTFTEYPMRAAAGGGAVAYVAGPGEEGGNGITGTDLGNQIVATRNAEGNWQSVDVTPQIFSANGEVEPPVYEWFSDEVSSGVLSTEYAPAFAAAARPEGPAECYALYAWNGTFHALFSKSEVSSFCGHDRGQGAAVYTAQNLLFSGMDGDAEGGTQPEADWSLLFETPAALNAGEEEAPEGEGENLYDSVDGVPYAVNVLPSGKSYPDATFGGTSGEPYHGEAANQIPGDFSGAISASGSRVFWTSLAPFEELEVGGEVRLIAQPSALYAREDPASPTATSVEIDASEAPSGSGQHEQEEREERSGGGRFWAATREGTRVFFTDCARLVEESTAVTTERCARPAANSIGPLVYTGNDLYEYDFDRPVGERLKDLTVDHEAGDPLGANVQGVLGASEDGSYVYFVAGGSLAPGTEPRKCREPEEEVLDGAGVLTGAEVALLQEEQELEERGRVPSGRGCNLYVWHEGGTRFIAALAAKDDRILRYALSGNSQRVGDWLPNMGLRSAEVSPDGRTLVFESGQQLTGYDNTDLDEQRPREENPTGNLGLEIFVYSAEDGSLICASCDPTGAPPVRETAAGGPESYGGTYLPPSLNPTYMHRWMSSNGDRVFFDSSQPLVGQDTNGIQDVYEWEREGEGSCTDRPTPASDRGCVYLMSGGTSSDDSDLLDADASGDNVFFTHRGLLGEAGLPGNRNSVFDARVGGGTTQVSEGCVGPECQEAPPATPSFSAPSTAVLGGTEQFTPGRSTSGTPPKLTTKQKLAAALRACRKKKAKKKRIVCEKRARAKYKVKGRMHKKRTKQGKHKSRGARK